MAFYAKTSGAYSRDSPEGLNNGREVYNYLSARGWTVNAVCGLLGNIAHESGYNPWRWQSDIIPTFAQYSGWDEQQARAHGYGLMQFTPANKYIDKPQGLSGYAPNFADRAGNQSDGYAQLQWMLENEGYYSTSAYPISFSNYKSSTQPADYLAAAWLYNYERPRDPAATVDDRKESALYWYGVLSITPPEPPPETFQLRVSASPARGGSVSGGGTYQSGTVVSITATPNMGYEFVRWGGDVGGTTNPTAVTITGDMRVIAQFRSTGPTPTQFLVEISAEPPEGGTVSGGGYYSADDVATIIATPNEGFQFDGWCGDIESGNSTVSFQVADNMEIIAYFLEISPPDPPTPEKRKKFPIYLMMKRRVRLW